MDDASLKDILKLAHKTTSPRSITDTETASLSPQERYATDINRYTSHFLRTVLGDALQVMCHFMRLTVHPFDVSYALEQFVKNHYSSRQEETNTNDFENQTEEPSDDSEWEMSDSEDGGDENQDDYLSDENQDDDLSDDDESDGDDSSDNFFNFDRGDLNCCQTPLFDASFEPLSSITISNSLVRDIRFAVQDMFRTDPQWADGAMEKLCNALYAFIVTKLRDI